MVSQRFDQVKKDAGQITRLLQNSDVEFFNLEQLEKLGESILDTLPGVVKELTQLQMEHEKKEKECQHLQEECEGLERDIEKLDEVFREKKKEHQKLKNARFQIQQPDTQKKSQQLKKLQEDCQALEEQVSAKEMQLKPLQEQYDTYKKLEMEITRVINETRDEESKTVQLEQEIKKFKADWERIVNEQVPKAKQERDKHFLAVLRLVLKAKHQNLNPLEWDEVLNMIQRLPADTSN